jgi:hypothetical protein
MKQKHYSPIQLTVQNLSDSAIFISTHLLQYEYMIASSVVIIESGAPESGVEVKYDVFKIAPRSLRVILGELNHDKTAEIIPDKSSRPDSTLAIRLQLNFGYILGKEQYIEHLAKQIPSKAGSDTLTISNSIFELNARFIEEVGSGLHIHK